MKKETLRNIILQYGAHFEHHPHIIFIVVVIMVMMIIIKMAIIIIMRVSEHVVVYGSERAVQSQEWISLQI